MKMKPCLWCETPHRYGTTDPYHEWVAMACINSLRYKVEELERKLEREKKTVMRLRTVPV